MTSERGKPYEGAAPAGVITPQPTGEKRVALVIGNGAYRNTTTLPNPVNDARQVGAKLSSLGFDVVGGADGGIDLDYGSMAARVRDFGRRLRDGADTALLFFAGHGIQVTGRNYLVPVDATLEVESDVGSELFELQHLLNQMERRDRTSIVILDACRNNPLAQNLARAMGLDDARSAGITEGLAEQRVVAGTLIAYATQPGHVAYDGDGQHGFFTEALLDHIERPGHDIELMLRDVRGRVMTATQTKRLGPQVPWVHSSLLGAFYFRPLERQPELAVAADSGPETGPRETGTTMSDAAAAWPDVRDSRDPRRLARFEQHFAGTWFADEARELREQIEAEIAEAARQRIEPEARAKAEEETAGAKADSEAKAAAAAKSKRQADEKAAAEQTEKERKRQNPESRAKLEMAAREKVEGEARTASTVAAERLGEAKTARQSNAALDDDLKRQKDTASDDFLRAALLNAAQMRIEKILQREPWCESLANSWLKNVVCRDVERRMSSVTFVGRSKAYLSALHPRADGKAAVPASDIFADEKTLHDERALRLGSWTSMLSFRDIIERQTQSFNNRRKHISAQGDVSTLVLQLRGWVIDAMVVTTLAGAASDKKWEPFQLKIKVKQIFDMDLPVEFWAQEAGITSQEMRDRLMAQVDEKALAMEEDFGAAVMRKIEKQVVLCTIDELWRQHKRVTSLNSQALEKLSPSPTYPNNDFKRESYCEMEFMWAKSCVDIIEQIFHVKFQPKEDRETLETGEAVGRTGVGLSVVPMKDSKPSFSRASIENGRSIPGLINPNDPASWGKVSRNALCPCGSEMKYKHCHGSYD